MEKKEKTRQVEAAGVERETEREERRKERLARPRGRWKQGEIEELLSDRHRTEKLSTAFELLHTRAFPSDERPPRMEIAPGFFSALVHTRVRAREFFFFRRVALFRNLDLGQCLYDVTLCEREIILVTSTC